MVAAFPLIKLGVLLVKQVTKPLANSIARRARSSKFFREKFCVPVAQLFHWYDVKVRMRILNMGKVTKVPKLDEQKAIDTGAQVSVILILSQNERTSLSFGKVVVADFEIRLHFKLILSIIRSITSTSKAI